MTNIFELSLTKIVNGIKNKDFTSEEVTKSFINKSQKSKKSAKKLFMGSKDPRKVIGAPWGCFRVLRVVSDNFLEKSNFSDFYIFSDFTFFKKSEKFDFSKKMSKIPPKDPETPPRCPNHLSGVLGTHKQLFGTFLKCLRFSPILLLK